MKAFPKEEVVAICKFYEIDLQQLASTLDLTLEFYKRNNGIFLCIAAKALPLEKKFIKACQELICLPFPAEANTFSSYARHLHRDSGSMEMDVGFDQLTDAEQRTVKIRYYTKVVELLKSWS